VNIFRPDYDPRFVEFLISEGVREYLRIEIVGHTGPYGEVAIRRAVDEALPRLHGHNRFECGVAGAAKA